ncbi:hypothetical protein V5799_032717 [Amblyomma americanum]|uniref:Uncharacterized protein n=1 Tax=Amblyomma americanum TaxID=6943 RepID=A0AAQ4DQD4_AMBAM
MSKVSGRGASTCGGSAHQRPGVHLADGFRFVSRLLWGAPGVMRNVACRFRVVAAIPRLVFCTFAKIATWLRTSASAAVAASSSMKSPRSDDGTVPPTLRVMDRLINMAGTTYPLEISLATPCQRESVQGRTGVMTARALRQRKFRLPNYALTAAGNRSSRRRAGSSKTRLQSFAWQPRESPPVAHETLLLGRLLREYEEMRQYFAVRSSSVPTAGARA